MPYVWFTLFSFVIWLGRQIGVGVLGLAIDAWLVVVVFYIWQKKYYGAAIFIIFLVSLLIDLTNFSTWPLYTLTTWFAGAIYILLIEPILISGSKWIDFMHVIIFLGLWRLVRLINLWVASEYGHWPYINLDWSIDSWLLWFGAGLLLWLIIDWLVNKLLGSKLFKYWQAYAKRS